MANYSKLFEPGKIGSLTVKNRIVMPAMGNRFCGIWGEVTDTLIDWYRRRAKGGAGLIILEATVAAGAMDPLRVVPRVLRCDDWSFLPGLTRLTEAIHENGARAAVQLSPGGGAQSKAGPWMPGLQFTENIQPVSPSGVPAIGHKDQPRILTVSEIHKIVELCGKAAWNARQAEFDMVEIHAHGGYLIAEFMSPYFNKRTDEYGGSLENRCRFLMEILASMRQAVGPKFPITVKYSIEDFLPGGWDVKQSQELAKKLEAGSASGIGISSGVHEAKMPAVLPYFYAPGAFIPFAEAMKAASALPVFVGGRLDDPELGAKVIKEGKADFLYEGRALIADPDWPKKVASGEYDEVRPCLACNECRQGTVNLRLLRCSVNATAGREGELEPIRPVDVKKKVLVVGGGPGGMEAARIAASRGHQVTLCEKQRQLGGLALMAGIHNEKITEFINWEIAQIKKLPVEVKLNTEVTPSLVDQIKPDAVIIAGGGTFASPDIPGIDGDNVFSSKDLLNVMNGIPLKKGVLLRAISPFAKHLANASMVSRMLESNFPIKKKVAVIGGQFPGCSLALFLAHKGKEVTIIEESDSYGYDMEAHTMVALRNEIEAGNVKVITSANIKKIADNGITYSNGSGADMLEEADSVIVALDLLPSESTLARALTGKVKDVYTIGDALSFRRIRRAVSEGYVTAYKL